jgi:hypothetical protein
MPDGVVWRAIEPVQRLIGAEAVLTAPCVTSGEARRMEKTLGTGVTLHAPDDFEFAPRSTRSRRRGATAAAPDEAALVLDDVLDAEFDEVPTDGVLSSRRGASATPVRITVDVEPGQDAVVLLEGDDGVLQWLYPDDVAAGSTRRGGSTTPSARVFTLAGPGDGGGRRGALGWIGDRLIDPVRVRVLRFVAREAVKAAVDHVEGDMVEGLIVMGDDPEAWTPKGEALPAGLLNSDAPRVLLMVHGTFSTTIGTFAAMAKTNNGAVFLASARAYDAVIGFDHKTLAVDPMANARDMMKALEDLPQGTRIDAVAYSRGGLVFRTLAEVVAPKQRPDLVFENAVFVGCTNGGTNLAEPQNWKALIDLYTNIALAGAKTVAALTGGAVAPLAEFAIKTLARFVQVVPEVAINDKLVPGLAAMQPKGDFVKVLNGAESALSAGRRYAVIGSDFQPRIDLDKNLGGELVEFLINRVVDRLLDEANDLVVHTASMSEFGARHDLLDPTRRVLLDPAQVIYHTIYFASETVAGQLSTWLFPTGEKGLQPSGRRSRMVEVERGAPAAELVAPISPELQTYHFAAEVAAICRVSAPTPLFVTISREALKVAGDAVSQAAEAGADPNAEIQIGIVGLENCRVMEGEPSTVSLRPPTAGALSVRFTLEGAAAGKARVQVEVRQGPRSLAMFLLEPVFVTDDTLRLTAGSSAAVAPAPDPRGPAVLRIYEILEDNKLVRLKFDLSSVSPALNAMDEINVRVSIDGLVVLFLTELEGAYGLYKQNYQNFLARIRDFSIIQTDGLIPEKIRQTLWDNRAKIEAIQVVSDAPCIPWELLCIADPKGESQEEPRFLCEWGLVRWLYNAGWPTRTLNLRGDRVRYVIPEYVNEGPYRPLAGAQAERDMLESRFTGAHSIPASFSEVCDFLRHDAKSCDVLHFACHGEATQKAVLTSDLVLAGGQRPDLLSYNSVDANANFGEPGAPGSGLVFINACQTGREGEGVAGVAGFAEAFIRPNRGKGAQVFVGALWSVDDKLALNFASAFYDELIAGSTLAEAGKAARKACKGANDFTWLAYSIYGEPFARMSQS